MSFSKNCGTPNPNIIYFNRTYFYEINCPFLSILGHSHFRKSPCSLLTIVMSRLSNDNPIKSPLFMVQNMLSHDYPLIIPWNHNYSRLKNVSNDYPMIIQWNQHSSWLKMAIPSVSHEYPMSGLRRPYLLRPPDSVGSGEWGNWCQSAGWWLCGLQRVRLSNIVWEINGIQWGVMECNLDIFFNLQCRCNSSWV